MNLDQLTNKLAINAASIHSLLQGVTEEQARWKPDPRSWSLLEVINHLYDEEREDFRPRLDGVLHRPDQPWQPNDPEGWVTQRNYNERDLEKSVQNFLDERQESLVWLKFLPDPDWQAVFEAPFGRITAGDLIASWVAHDLLHLRQLIELHWAYNIRSVEPYSVRYAGEW